MTTTTPTIMKVLGLSLVVLGGVEVEGDGVVKPGVGMLGTDGVGEGTMVVVETTASPGGEGGDSGSPGAPVDDTIIAVIVRVHVSTKKLN